MKGEKAMSTRWNGIVKDAARSLLEMFETGEMPEAVALTIIKRREGDTLPSHLWSLGNRILMIAQGTIDARGFRQWKEVGRYVKKGARAINILAPVTRKYVELDAKTGTEKERTLITGFRPISVYRFEDTDGKPLIKPDYQPKDLPPFWGVAEHMGIDISYLPCDGDYYGSYSPNKQKITLCSQDALVYFHELSHGIHYTIRDLKHGPDPEKEVVAETSAAILCQLQGITGYECQAYDYIREYAGRMKEPEVVKAIMRVLADVEAIVTKIMEIAELTQNPQVAQSA